VFPAGGLGPPSLVAGTISAGGAARHFPAHRRSESSRGQLAEHWAGHTSSLTWTLRRNSGQCVLTRLRSSAPGTPPVVAGPSRGVTNADSGGAGSS
jgi:hypothetical protein